MESDVPVDDPSRVGERQGIGNLGDDVHCIGEWERPAGDALIEAFPGDEFHHQRHRPVLGGAGLSALRRCRTGVEHLDDVRVGQAGDGAGLRQQAAPEHRVSREVRGQHLDGHLAPGAGVLATVNGGHPAAPQDRPLAVASP